MELEKVTVWLIMSRCKKWVAKGSGKGRALVEVTDRQNRAKFLTYSTRSMAESAIKSAWFSTPMDSGFPYPRLDPKEYLEPVQCELTLNLAP